MSSFGSSSVWSWRNVKRLTFPVTVGSNVRRLVDNFVLVRIGLYSTATGCPLLLLGSWKIDIPFLSHQGYPRVANNCIYSATSETLSGCLYTSFTADVIECYQNMMPLCQLGWKTNLDLFIKLRRGNMVYNSTTGRHCEHCTSCLAINAL